MLQLKSQLTCSNCSRIFRDPILLPCADSICRQHLKWKEVLKQNRIKCTKCNEEFGVKDNDFKSNEALSQSIESQSYLNQEEKILKQGLEASIRKFFEFYDEFAQNKAKLDLDVFNHFQEMRFKIDEQREELKKIIDDIALAMIDETNKHQEKYLNSLKEHFSPFDGMQSLEEKLNDIEDTFRDPNLPIETIRDMQQKQEESLNEIQMKLTEMNQVKDNLEETNYFKANLSSLKQEEASMFGSFKLSEYSSMNPFNSQILKDEQQCFELIKLCEFSPNDKWSLLYRATRDGFGSSVFHSRCDGHSNTLTIFKAKHSRFIFGGFTTTDWDSTSEWKSDLNAFIFSLTNKDNKPLKMKIDYIHESAIFCHFGFGPMFGDDIIIKNNANTTMDSYSRLGANYIHPEYAYKTNEADTFLAGSHCFQLDEIEIYQKE
jgi:hypothetical protein